MNKKDWLLARQTGIGGSDAAAVLGLSKYRTPYDVFIDKTTEPEEISLTPAMRAGIKLESVVAEYYAEESGNKVINSNKILKHKKIPFLIGNNFFVCFSASFLVDEYNLFFSVVFYQCFPFYPPLIKILG